MKTTLKKEISNLMDSKFIGKVIIKPEKFSGLTIKHSSIKVGIEFDTQIHLSFFESNQHLILDENDEIELQ